MPFSNKKYRRYLLMCGILAAAFLSFGSASLYAYWQISGKTTNRISTTSYRTEIVENYQEPSAVYPGMKVDKVVNVSNTGTTDCMVRVHTDIILGTRDAEGILLQDEQLDTNVIELSYNRKFWTEKDGFWYYKDVLKAGSKTREPLFESFRISEQAGNSYKGKDAEIIVTMESIQAGEAMEKLWGITEKEIGIVYMDSGASNMQAEVHYLGSDSGFQFEGLGTDLFTNFKHLLPGCSRSQTIRITNESNHPAALSFYAAPARQEALTKEEEEQIEELISKYATVEISDGTTLLYQGPVNGNPDGAADKSMGESSAIKLGNFQPGQEKELYLSLRLDPDLTLEFCELTGNIDWIFTTEGNDAAAVPKTGDTSQILLLFLCFAGSTIVLVFILFIKRGTNHAAL